MISAIALKDKVKAVELVYDYLTSKRLNGITYHYDSDRGEDCVILIHPNLIDAPIVLLRMYVSAGPTLRIFSEIGLGSNKGGGIYHPIAQIDLTDPGSLESSVKIIEAVVNKYNSLAKLMDECGSGLISDSAGLTIILSEFKLKR